MKKIIAMLLVCTSMFAQKADIESNKVRWNVNRPDYLNTIKTFSYEIQDDGEYWNYEPNAEYFPEDTYPSLASLTNGISIDGLEPVDINADLKIIVGFLGNQLKMDNGLIRLNGTLNLMIVVDSNKLLHSLIEDVQLSVVVNPDKYPLETPNHRNQTKARILTTHIQKLIDELNYLFVDQPEVNLPFGVFDKAKTEVTQTFNTNSKTYIERIQESPSDKSLLDEAIKYWRSQIDIDFGKSMKDKIKDKVIYVNLTSASILKGDMDGAKKYHQTVKENSGFFDSWTIDYDKLFKKTDYINELKNQSLPSIDLYPNLAYFITIGETGVYTFKNKESAFLKIEIERFIPTVQSGITSLDSYRKPRVFIYDENGSMEHSGGNQNHILTSSGMEIIFKVDNGDFKPHIKQNDGSYSIYYGY
jgi:hypothetical protein